LKSLPLTYCLLVLCLLPLSGYSQQPDTAGQDSTGFDAALFLQEIRVEALRLKSRTGFERERVDSVTILRYANTHLGQLLQEQSGLFIRSYGVSGQATPSIRGTGASHTQVYWNGLLLNSPTLGQTDLSTLPVVLSDEIAIDYGGASLLEGSGSLGGSISLSTHSKENQLRIHTAANSMQNLGGSLLYAYGSNRLRGSTKVVWQENNNRFAYTSISGDEKIMEHAFHRSRGFLQELSYRVAPAQQLRFASWYQQDLRELQPSLLVNLYDEQLEEASWRNSLQYEIKKQQYNFSFLNGWSYNLLPQAERFGEEASGKAYSTTYQAKARYYRKVTANTYLRGGLDYLHSQAEAEAFNGTKKQDRLGLLLAGEINFWNRFSLDALLRHEWVPNIEASKLLPSLALQYQFNTNWSLALNGSYNYRVLSLNEQYWASYSRRELQPEESRNLELLMQQEHKRDKLALQQSLSLFSYWVENWIIWVPGLPSWKPENAREVFNRGLDYSFRLNSSPNERGFWQLKGGYTFTLATNQQPFRGNRDAIGKQLIFTPRHKGSLQAVYRCKNWDLSLDEVYTGKRLSRSDATEYLPHYLLTNGSIGHQLSWSGHLLATRLGVNNLFNYHYQLIPFYAMPGRVWELSIRYQLAL
jgi:vitamin B12 transporter